MKRILISITFALYATILSAQSEYNGETHRIKPDHTERRMLRKMIRKRDAVAYMRGVAMVVLIFITNKPPKR